MPVRDVDQDVAERTLQIATSQAKAGSEVEVIVARRRLGLTRFANSNIHQSVDEDICTLRLKMHASGKTAAAATTRTGRHGIKCLVEQVTAALEVSPPDPGWPGLAPPEPVVGRPVVDDAIVSASSADRAGMVADFVAATDGLAAAGYCRTQHRSVVYVNSAGHHAAGDSTEGALEGICRAAGSSDEPADGSSRSAAGRRTALDGSALGARAAAKARAAIDPIELSPGRYELVLEPAATADLLYNLAVYGFNGKLHSEGRSFMAPGEQQFDRALTLVDDAFSANAVGLPFDADGTPKQPRVLVDAGVTTAVTHDRRSAFVSGVASTGHAGFELAVWGPFPPNMYLVPAQGPDVTEVAGPAADASVLRLISDVKKGLLVTDMWYTRAHDSRTLTISGATRNGVWLIDRGEIVAPVRNFRFVQNYAEALSPGMILGVGSHASTFPPMWNYGSLTAPALHLASWNCTW